MKYNEEGNNSGIVRLKQNGIEYTVWTHTNVVRPYIKKFLRDMFPDKLIVRELNQIDLTILEENLPIEIQSTIVNINGMHFAQWEKYIRTQIEQNIIGYGRCWLFFDSDLLKGMINASKNMSINMDWFRKFIKEEKLRVFAISYNGTIEEKRYKDFDFLSKVSQTCIIAAETDDMILNKNKMKILANVMNGYSFTQEEIDKFESDYEKYSRENKISNTYENDRVSEFLKKQNERSKLYGNILHTMGCIRGINQLLCRNINKSTIRYSRHDAKYLGIFDTYGGNQYNSITKFIDRFDICKYFPGYLRNKEIWDKLRGHNLNARQFDNVVTGKNDVINGLDHYFNENNDISNNVEQDMDKDTNQNQTDNDKEVNIKIDNKDHTININIKTKQKTIEDAWS